MLSEFIPSQHSYSAVHLAVEQIHQRSVHFGPLVLETNLLKNQRLQQIGDQPVSRRFEPSSRNFLIGEQPNPWDLLQPQDKLSRPLSKSSITRGVDYTFASGPLKHQRVIVIYCIHFRNHYLHLLPPLWRDLNPVVTGLWKPILYFIESMMYG